MTVIYTKFRKIYKLNSCIYEIWFLIVKSKW